MLRDLILDALAKQAALADRKSALEMAVAAEEAAARELEDANRRLLDVARGRGQHPPQRLVVDRRGHPARVFLLKLDGNIGDECVREVELETLSASYGD
jgi:hypothetical protein